MPNEDFFVSGKKEIKIDYNGKEVIFYANEIGYLQSQQIAVNASKENNNSLAALVAASITDPDGNHFTYEEVLRLKKEYAEPFFAAVVELNNFGGKEKN